MCWNLAESHAGATVRRMIAPADPQPLTSFLSINEKKLAKERRQEMFSTVDLEILEEYFGQEENEDIKYKLQAESVPFYRTCLEIGNFVNIWTTS